MKRKSLGASGEAAAALWYEARGFAVTGRNVRVGRDEIDLVAEDQTRICFVEVKTRRSLPGGDDRLGTPADAVDERKRGAMIRAAEGYLAAHPTEKAPRIDVAEVFADPGGDTFSVLGIEVHENAVKKTGKFSRKSYKDI